MTTIPPISNAVPFLKHTPSVTQQTAIRFHGSNTDEGLTNRTPALTLELPWNKPIIQIENETLDYKGLLALLYDHHTVTVVRSNRKATPSFEALKLTDLLCGKTNQEQNALKIQTALKWLCEMESLSEEWTENFRTTIGYCFTQEGLQLVKELFPQTPEETEYSVKDPSGTTKRISKLECLKHLKPLSPESKTTGWQLLKALQKEPSAFFSKLGWLINLGISTSKLYDSIADSKITPETMSQKLEQLTQMGWVQKTVILKNTYWKLSQEGRALLKSASPLAALNIPVEDKMLYNENYL